MFKIDFHFCKILGRFETKKRADLKRKKKGRFETKNYRSIYKGQIMTFI